MELGGLLLREQGSARRPGAGSRYRTMLSVTGLIVMLCGLLMTTPLLGLIGWPDEAVATVRLLIPALTMSFTGLLAWRLLRPRNAVALTVQEGGIIVLASWTAVSLFSAWALMRVEALSFTHALFEAVSGWTTTGLSVVDVTRATHASLLWRSTMQLAGGAGLAVIMLSTIAGPNGPALSLAEGREQLVPHVRQSAKLVVLIYCGYALVGVFGLRIAGMSWFDAINHSFCAVSTGGFSTHPQSVGYYDLVAVEAVTIPLMILGNTSFITAWALLRGNLRAVAGNGEVRLSVVLVPVAAASFFLLTARALYPSLGKAVRVAVFEAVTALTTTGYSTTTYAEWGSASWVILIVLMLIGGGTCSTAGGVKQYRIYLLWRSFVWELRSRLLPPSAVTAHLVWEGEERISIDDRRLRQVGTFLFLYLATWLAGALVMTVYGYGLAESLFEYASSVGTVGLSVGVTSATTPAAVLWTQIAGMLLGRLEFFVILTASLKLVRDARAAVTTVRRGKSAQRLPRAS